MLQSKFIVRHKLTSIEFDVFRHSSLIYYVFYMLKLETSIEWKVDRKRYARTFDFEINVRINDFPSPSIFINRLI